MANNWDVNLWPATSLNSNNTTTQSSIVLQSLYLSGLVCPDVTVPVQTTIRFFRVSKMSQIFDFEIDKVVALSSNFNELVVMAQDELPVTLTFIDEANRISAENRIQTLIDTKQNSPCI